MLHDTKRLPCKCQTLLSVSVNIYKSTFLWLFVWLFFLADGYQAGNPESLLGLHTVYCELKINHEY